MLTEAQIRNGYALLFGSDRVVTTPEVNFWLGVASGGAITLINFVGKLAAHTLVEFSALASLSDDQKVWLVNAKNYLYYEPLEEVLRPLANWKDPVSERIVFNTDILQARYGSEQRRQLLHYPRVTLEYTILSYKAQLQHLVNQIKDSQGHLIWTPLWQEIQVLSADLITLGDLSTVPRIRVGKYLLFSSYDSFELVDVVKVGETYQFEHNLSTAYTSSPWFIPVLPGNIREKVSFSYITGAVASGRVSAQLQVLSDKAIWKNTKTLRMVNNYPLMPAEQNWVTPTSLEITRPSVVLDYGTGIMTSYDLHGYSDNTRTLSFIGKRDDYGIRDFFLEQAGRYASFYCPTFVNDLTIAEGFVYSSADKSILVKDVAVTPNKISKYLYIEFHNKPAIICEFTVPTAENGLEKIPVYAVSASGAAPTEDAFNFPWDYKSVKRISYLPKCRFVADTLEVSWFTPQYYNVTVSIIHIQ